MIFPDNRKLFTIKEMTQACGVSRTTLIRMEEDGFLKPYRVDPDSGYRYYDLQNVTELLINPDYLVCVSFRTHQAIHYGDAGLLPQLPVERSPGDTKLW